jgi:septum site-determining protein MinC
MTGPFNEDDTSGFEEIVPLQDLPMESSGLKVKDLGRGEGPERIEELETETRSSVITARGTAEGLVLRIDGRVDEGDLTVAAREFLESRRSFIQGNDVAFEWVGRKPSEELVQHLTTILSEDFRVSVRGSKLKASAFRQPAPTQASQESTNPSSVPLFSSGRSTSTRSTTPQSEKSVSLFDGIDTFESRASTATNPLLWDEPDTRIIYGTLRSGQKIETEHSIIIFGDVNSGAEVTAGGDIVILGTLRGIAHAGAYDESGGGRVIFGLNLQPTQLRIGLVISRGAGAEHVESTPRGGIPEIARVEGNLIVVEPYQSRTVWGRRRE